MKDKLKGVLASTAVITLVLTGCVSTKKYKASEAMVQQLRTDSTQLAQQTASLNGNVKDLQDRNTALERSLDSSKNSYSEQGKNLSYYQDYFNRQQTTMAQVTDQLKGALAQAGMTDADIQQENNVVYVRLDESKMFKKNSYVVTSDGKKVLTGLAGSIKDRPDVNVFVSDGDSSGGQGGMNMSGNENMSGNDNMSGNRSDNSTAGTTTRHHTHHHAMSSQNSGSGSASGQGSTAGNSGQSHTGSYRHSHSAQSQDTTGNRAVAHHRRRHHMSSEGGMTYYSNNMGNSHRSRAYALQQGRMYAVANNMLQDGVPKVNLLLHQQNAGMGQSNQIKVIITPATNDFKPLASRE